MPSLVTKLLSLIRNPRARAALDQARRQAANPQNRQRLAQLRARLGRRR